MTTAMSETTSFECKNLSILLLRKAYVRAHIFEQRALLIKFIHEKFIYLQFFIHSQRQAASDEERFFVCEWLWCETFECLLTPSLAASSSIFSDLIALVGVVSHIFENDMHEWWNFFSLHELKVCFLWKIFILKMLYHWFETSWIDF